MRIECSLIILAFVLLGVLEAQPSPTRQAEVFFEAGNYVQARNQYELLQADYLPPWQQAILAYDIGTVLLAQGEMEKALAYYQNISFDSVDLPLLKQRLSKNRARAHLWMAEARVAPLLSDGKATSEDFQSAQDLLRQVHIDLDLAAQADCELAKIEGARTCVPAADLEAMALVTKKLLDQLLLAQQNYQLAHLSIEDGLALLLAAEEDLAAQLGAWQNAALEPAQPDSLRIEELQQAKKWQPMWDLLLNRINSSALSKVQKDAFEQAFRAYELALNLKTQRNFNGSKLALEESHKILYALFHQVMHEIALPEAFAHLKDFYGFVLSQEPLQPLSLAALNTVQEVLRDRLEKEHPALVTQGFILLTRDFKAAAAALTLPNPIQARLLLEAARYEVIKMMQALHPAAKMSAKSILEEAWHTQSLVLRLTRLHMRAQQKEQIASTVDEVLQLMQEDVLQSAKHFMPAVKAEQQVAFASAENKVAMPWDEIVPLFSAGEQAARRAGELMGRTLALQEAVVAQEKAVNKWQAALALWAAKRQAQSTAAPENIEKETQAEGAPGKKGVEQVLKLVQEMENEDRSKLELKSVPSTKGVERPW